MKGVIALPHISAHNLRHTGCTRISEAGVDPKVLQYIMGHSRIAVTMEVYNHVSSERNRKEMDKLEKIRLIG
ncbi:MAG: tyrosine-type recombinase/integrase [Lachnospiraceae bacterium]|nr:tyrosine-type recombinase/integrase [Lachnospiraceae bacterium]